MFNLGIGYILKYNNRFNINYFQSNLKRISDFKAISASSFWQINTPLSMSLGFNLSLNQLENGNAVRITNYRSNISYQLKNNIYANCGANIYIGRGNQTEQQRNCLLMGLQIKINAHHQLSLNCYSIRVVNQYSETKLNFKYQAYL